MLGLREALRAALPRGWEVVVRSTGTGCTVQCHHVVLGGHEFHWDDEEGQTAAATAAAMVARLGELGLVEASERMPELSPAETETLREAFAVIGATNVSREQARSVVGVAESLGQLSLDAGTWAMAAVDLLEPWHQYSRDGTD